MGALISLFQREKNKESIQVENSNEKIPNSNASSPLLDLPREIILEIILQHLSFQEVCYLSMACSYLNQLLKENDERIWKIVFERENIPKMGTKKETETGFILFTPSLYLLPPKVKTWKRYFQLVYQKNIEEKKKLEELKKKKDQDNKKSID